MWIPIAAAVVVAALIVTFVVVRGHGDASSSGTSSSTTAAPSATGAPPATPASSATETSAVETSDTEPATADPASSSVDEPSTSEDTSSLDETTESSETDTSSASEAAASAAPPSWCTPDSESNGAAYDVFQPGTGASELTAALAEIARIPELAGDATALSTAIAAQQPAANFASEAIGRLLLSGADPASMLDQLNKDSKTACGTDVFDSDDYGSILDRSPYHNSDNGSISEIYGAYGECGDHDSVMVGIMAGLRTGVACGSELMITDLHSGALREFGVLADGATQFTVNDDTIGWMTSVVTPASGLNPPVWTVTADVLDIAKGAAVSIPIDTPKVDGVVAQQGDVSLDSVGGHTFSAAVMAGGNTYSVVFSSAGKVLAHYTTEGRSRNMLDSAQAVVGAYVSTGNSTGQGSFFDGYTGGWVAPPGWDGADYTSIVTDDGCDRVGLVLTGKRGDPSVNGPNSLYSIVKGAVTRTAFPAFDWRGVDIVGLVPQGVVVRASDSSGKSFVELISAKNAAVVWRLGSDRIQPGSATMWLGFLNIKNNSNDWVVVDPATGQESSGLSSTAPDTSNWPSDGWFALPDGSSTDYVTSNHNGSIWVLTPADGVCK